MSDYYFRGTLVEFWVFVYAEWRRGQARVGFEFLQPNPDKTSLESYIPARYDEICLDFYSTGRGECAVSVTAASVLDADLVKLEVNIHVGPLKRYGDSVLQGWESLKARLVGRGLLINPHVLLGAMSPIPPQPGGGADLTVYFDFYHRERAEGRKCTLKEIAERAGYGYSYVRQLHARYLKERRQSQPAQRAYKNIRQKRTSLDP